MDHPLLMDDFDDDLTSTKSVSEEDLFQTVKKDKKQGPTRKISEFSSSDEQELSLELTAATTNESEKNKNNSSSSPIEIKGSPVRGKHGRGSINETKCSPCSSSSVESSGGNGNSRLSIFRVLTRRSSNQGKHKKLQDNWIQAREPVLDGVTFCVKFLGSTLIDKTGASDAAEATKTVIQMVKAGQKTSRVGLKVSTSGITLLEPNSGETRLEISIYDIAHCSTDSSFPNVFSFIATNKNDVHQIYCFATKRKLAKHITLTIAQSFSLAFEIWQNSSLEKDTSRNFGGAEDRVIIGSADSDSGSSNGTSHNPVEDIRAGQWVHFDEVDEVTCQIDAINTSFNMVTLAPFNSGNSSTKSSSRTQQSTFSEHEDLLICLN